MTPVPPVWNRAMRSARSLASLPVQVNIAWAGPIECVASSRSAYPTTPSVRYLVCVLRVASCRATAAVTAGCECPTDGTLLYASRYATPSGSYRCTPAPRANSTGSS